MNCPNCENQMTGGAPHCETIKVQMECHSCGHYENEYYTPDEMKAIELAQEGYHYQAAQRAVAETGGNLKESRELLQSRAIAPNGGIAPGSPESVMRSIQYQRGRDVRFR